MNVEVDGGEDLKAEAEGGSGVNVRVEQVEWTVRLYSRLN